MNNASQYANYIKVAGACLNQTPLDWQGNRRRILSAIEAAKAQRVALLCLPELVISGYGCEDSFFSDDVLNHTLISLADIIPHCQGIAVSLGLFLNVENSLYNVVCLIHDGKLLGFVAKQELAGDGIHYEPRWFKPWPKDRVVDYHFNGQTYPFGDLIFEVDGIRIGFEICEDAWNGVRPAQQHYLNNVDIILNPSASHFAFGKTSIRQGLVCEASRSYSCTYIYSNLLGNEAGRVIYDGEIIIAQSGKLLSRNRRFSFLEFQLLTAVVDIDAPRRSKKKLFSFKPELPLALVRSELPLPRTDRLTQDDIAPALSKNEEFYRAVTLGLFDYMRKSYSRGFVLSLSGGADSSACAVLAARAITEALQELGPSDFRAKVPYIEWQTEADLLQQLMCCIYQRTANSSTATQESAQALAQGLGLPYIDWSIEEPLQQYLGLVENHLDITLDWKQHDLALQNIQARARVPALWMVANLRNALLLTTSNRSEAAVGYATMDGDTAGGLAPLGGIDKAHLLQWLSWAQTELNIPALQYVNSLQPSAELRPLELAQTDESDLMPYPILDAIERLAIHHYHSPVQVYYKMMSLRSDIPKENLKIYIKRFFTLWARNQWKRERYAPSFHLDDANLDPRTWCRFPILNAGYIEELAALEALA
jgi:NAD+ synthase (glutamine-hydrolysing)